MLLTLRSRATAIGLVVFVATALVYHLGRPPYWLGEWGWTVDWATGLVILLGPVAAGTAAFRASSWGATPLLVSGVRGVWRHRVALWFTSWLLAMAVYLTSFVVLLAVTAATGPTDGLEAQFGLLGAGQLLVATAFGTLLGHAANRVVSVPLALAAFYLWEVAPPPTWFPPVLNPGASTGTPSGLGVDALALTAQLAVQVALALLLISLVGWLPLRGQRGVQYAVGLAGALAVVAAFAGSAAANANSTVYRSSPAWRCAGEKPQVCLLLGNTRQLEAWASAMKSAAGHPRIRALSLPAVFRQPPPVPDPRYTGFGVLVVESSTINLDPPRADVLADSIASPENCPQYYATSGGNHGEIARYWMSAWVRAQLTPGRGADGDPVMEAWMRDTPPQHQVDLAREVYARLTSCTATDEYARTLPTAAR
jgi:hypothetical protein